MKKQFPYFEFNTSTNPFAYIRTEEDVNKLIINVRNAAAKNSINLNEPENFYVELIISYLVNECNPCDRNINNIIKLLEVAKMGENQELYPNVDTTFGIMLRDGTTPGLYKRYSHYKYTKFKKSKTHNKAIEKYINLFKIISEESLLPELKNNSFPAQAILHTETIDYDVWFEASKESDICRSRKYTGKPIVIQLPYFLTDPKQIQAIRKYLQVDLTSFNLTNYLNANCQTILKQIINYSSQEV